MDNHILVLHPDDKDRLLREVGPGFDGQVRLDWEGTVFWWEGPVEGVRADERAEPGTWRFDEISPVITP